MLTKRTFKRLQHKLMLAFLVLSITPLSLLAVFFLQSHSDDLQTQSTTHLGFLRDHKKEKIIQYFDARHLEAKSFSRSELATASGGRFYGLVAAFHQLGKTKEEAKTLARKHFSPPISTKNPDEHILGNQRYNLLHKRYDWAFKEYLKDSDFSDILLVDIDGTVVYSSKKEATFAANLLSNKWINTAVGQTFSLIKEKVKERQAQSHLNLQNTSGHDAQTSPIIFTDFNLSQEGEMQSWFATPITQQGYLHSFALFKLPNHPLVKLLNTLPKENPNITTLLVGEDRLQRNLSKPPLSPIKSEAIDNALSGLIDVGSFINSKVERALGAYTPVFVMGKQWALILEIPEDEAFAQIYQLEKIFVAVMLLAIFFVILGSHLLSNSITAPLLKLTWAAEQVSAGDLDQKISSTNRQDEIGRLAVSFARMQRSVREKLSLIHDQNKTLEQNISLIKQKNKALKQADRMKDDFLATTSHELRTPLHGMIGLAQAMLATTQDGPERERQQSQLQMIINSGERLSSLVDDLLDYHKMRNGELAISLQAVDTANVIRLVIELSSHHLGAKPVRIINQLPIDLPLVRADEQRLEQVLYNLMSNAIKYTEEGKIVISATLLEKKLRIQVVDTGQGIPCDELEYIFEPLTQASEATSYRQGAGLGLSITKQLIDIMGGHLYVSSQPMVGTTLSFTLPLATQEDKAKTRLSNNSHFLAPKFNPVDIQPLPENPAGPLILVVDDEPVNLQVLNNFLRLEGYRVITAENGRQAIESIAIEKPALMLLDVMMPELSGYEVCAHLRERYNPAQLPIILLSALGKVQDKVRGFDAGANDYFIKPFNKHELSSRIRAYINASLTEQARENNQALKEEIHQKEKTESGLRTLQNALFNMLEMAPQAIVAITNKGEITFANLASASFFQRTQVALSYKLLSDFFPEKWPTPDLLEAFYRGEIKEIPFKIAGKTRLTHIEVKTLPQSSGLQMLLIINADNKCSSERVLLLENAVDTLADFAFSGEIEKLEDLRNLGNEFTHIADKFTHKQSKEDVLRECLVKVMILTLNHWKNSTGKSKFEMAEESGLWRVYLDRSTLQTRTLDKYLHVETVPKSPRWRSVINTIDFVLERCNEETKEREHLLFLRDKLQALNTR